MSVGMRLLILDTATEALSVALHDGTSVVAHRFEVIGRGHAERILPWVRDLLKEVSWPIGTLTGVAVGRGPGAFTGVRIGVSVAQGLAFALGVPGIAISDLEVVAVAASARAEADGLQLGAVVVALDARMGEVYAALCTVTQEGLQLEWEALCTPVDLPGRVGALERVVLAGHGFAAYPLLVNHFPSALAVYADQLPDAKYLAEVAVRKIRAGEAAGAEALEPVYLRDNVANQTNR